jgi:hypothetical protein
MTRVTPLLTTLAAAGLLPLAPAATQPPPAASPCAPGTRCLLVDSRGREVPNGSRRAQCAGVFPDYIVPATLFPSGYAGPWFTLAQDYPRTRPASETRPWAAIDFKAGKAQADAYLLALRDYAFDGMIEADFVPARNSRRRWYHAPLMNFNNGRELVHGLTEERPLSAPELGIKPGATVQNYAIGFYNATGAHTFARVFEKPNEPDASRGRFAAGTMVFKILFSDATPDDFADPGGDLLTGAPAWQIATTPNASALTTVRLLQMDVAVRDDRARPSGWVFGTFAFDRSATDASPWRRLRPVGLMWGNDPGYLPSDQGAGRPLRESIVSDQIPPYAKAHLGWAGRVNGPVDNPSSACLSCHQTAQTPAAAALLPGVGCSNAERLYWFRNLGRRTAFGAVSRTTCEPAATPKPVTLDYSLQLAVAVQNLRALGNVNPCTPPEEIPAPPEGPPTEYPILR